MSTQRLFVLLTLCACVAAPLGAQVRVDHGRHTRLQRFARDMAYGVAEGLAFAWVDQSQNDPSEWGGGSSGYEKRAASNVGEFVIQESVTEGLSALLKHSMDYTRCRCTNTGSRIGHALLAGVADEAPGGAWSFAIPRIVGAYSGAYAQSTWRPDLAPGDRARVAFNNGTTSLLIGVGINLFHEFVR